MQAPSAERARTTGERIAQGLSAVLALGPLVYATCVWTDLPARLPLHYGLDGRADRSGDARTFWLFPTLSLVLFLTLTLLERFPHVYNYPFKVTPQNQQAAYRLGRQTVLGFKTGVTAAFAYITVATVQTSLGRCQGLGTWFVPVLLCATLLGVVTSIYAFSRLRHRT